jgi:ubiquinone biosynthesis protein
MLKASWIPTPLVPPSARPPVPIQPVRRPSRLRTLYVLANLAGLLLAFLRSVVRRKGEPDQFPRQVREVFERMGGLWIKAGQFLALRIDLLPVPLCHELARLQSRALGFPPQVARAMVERELGAPLDRYFDIWEDEPFAAASIGQVHRARLRQEQVWVAVKVQKPWSAELFALDFAVMALAARIADALRVLPHMRWVDGLTELRQIMREELDFGFEAASTRTMRRVLRPHGLYVPKVFRQYGTSVVLVTEFLDMVLMADYLRVAQTDPERLAQWHAVNGVRPRVVARRLVHSFQRQMLEDNRYHGDMHPGNIGLLRDNRIALIDFGTTNFTENEYLQRFRAFMRAFATGQFAKGADLCLMLCASLPSIDLTNTHARLVRVLQSWATRTWVRELPFHDKSMDNLTLEVMQVLLKDGCTMEWAWLRLHRASSTLDASLIELYPGIDYRAMTRQYFVLAERRHTRRAIRAMGLRRAVTTATASLQVPGRVQEYAAAQAALIRREGKVFRGVTDRTTAAMATVISLGRLLLAVHVLATVAAAAATWQAARLTPAIAGWLSALPLGVPATDPHALVAVLIVDAWLWFALVRISRALRQGSVAPHARQPATA